MNLQEKDVESGEVATELLDKNNKPPEFNNGVSKTDQKSPAAMQQQDEIDGETKISPKHENKPSEVRKLSFISISPASLPSTTSSVSAHSSCFHSSKIQLNSRGYTHTRRQEKMFEQNFIIISFPRVQCSDCCFKNALLPPSTHFCPLLPSCPFGEVRTD